MNNKLCSCHNDNMDLTIQNNPAAQDLGIPLSRYTIIHLTIPNLSK